MTKITASLALTGAVIGFLGLPTAGTEAAVPPLKRHLSIPARGGSLSDYLLAIFTSAGIRGGIALVYDQCAESSEQFPEFTGSVQEALDKLTSTGHHLVWSQAGESLVVYNTPSAPPLLKVVVRKFQFSRKEPLTKASSDLFDAPETRAEGKALHLVEYGPEVGFAQLRQPTSQQDMVTLTNTTVLDALNNIAGNHAIWLYKESRCEKNIMSVNWPVQ